MQRHAVIELRLGASGIERGGPAQGQLGLAPTLQSKRRQSEFLALERRSRKLHRPWVTAPSTEDAYADYLKRARRRSSRCSLVCVAEDDAVAGVVNVSEIVLGA